MWRVTDRGRLLDFGFHGLAPMGNGVIGNTAVSGTVIQGSSPCSPAQAAHFARSEGRPTRRPSLVFGWHQPGPLVVCWGYRAPSSSGLGHHPLKVAARVRIPLGLPGAIGVFPATTCARQTLGWAANTRPRTFVICWTYRGDRLVTWSTYHRPAWLEQPPAAVTPTCHLGRPPGP